MRRAARVGGRRAAVAGGARGSGCLAAAPVRCSNVAPSLRSGSLPHASLCPLCCGCRDSRRCRPRCSACPCPCGSLARLRLRRQHVGRRHRRRCLAPRRLGVAVVARLRPRASALALRLRARRLGRLARLAPAPLWGRELGAAARRRCRGGGACEARGRPEHRGLAGRRQRPRVRHARRRRSAVAAGLVCRLDRCGDVADGRSAQRQRGSDRCYGSPGAADCAASEAALQEGEGRGGSRCGRGSCGRCRHDPPPAAPARRICA